MYTISKFFGGFLLNGRHSGESKSISNLVPPTIGDGEVSKKEFEIKLTSDGFLHEQFMPQKYAGEGMHQGNNLSPPLTWDTIPDETKEIVITIEDPDAPLWFPILHASVLLSVDKWRNKSLPEGILSIDKNKTNGTTSNFDYEGLTLGNNTIGTLSYRGPGPLAGHGPHRYVHTIFALSEQTNLKEGFTRKQLINEMNGKIIGRGRLDGFYELK